MSYIYIYLATLCVMWDVGSPIGDQTCAPCSGSMESNHWTAREVPCIIYHFKRTLLSKGNHQQNKKATYRMGGIFANHICNKGLISSTHKMFMITPTQKSAKDLNKHFLKKAYKWLTGT